MEKDGWHLQVHMIQTGGNLQIRCNNFDLTYSITE